MASQLTNLQTPQQTAKQEALTPINYCEVCDYKLINNDGFICASEKSENPKYECFLNNVSYELGCDTCLEKGIIRIVKQSTYQI